MLSAAALNKIGILVFYVVGLVFCNLLMYIEFKTTFFFVDSLKM